MADSIAESESVPPDSHISHSAATGYWSSCPASDSSMLGGLPQVSKTDIQGSKNFFAKLQRRSKTLDWRKRPSHARTQGPLSFGDEQHQEHEEEGGKRFAVERAVDCGAGIGRVTLNFLATVAETVDVVEPVNKFTEEISEGKAFSELRDANRIGNIHNVGLQDWRPEPQTYDLIWHQWCLGQLTDVELVEYLKRAKAAMKEGGWCVIKENVTAAEEDEFDDSDSSVTRALPKWKALFKEAGYRVDLEEVQRGFPKGLFVVRMWALRPT